MERKRTILTAFSNVGKFNKKDGGGGDIFRNNDLSLEIKIRLTWFCVQIHKVLHLFKKKSNNTQFKIKTENMDHKIKRLSDPIPNFSYLKSRLTGVVFALQVEALGPFDSDHDGRGDSRQRHEEKNDGHQEENVQRPISPLPKGLDVCVAAFRHSALSFFRCLVFWISVCTGRISPQSDPNSECAPAGQRRLIRAARSMTGFL